MRTVLVVLLPVLLAACGAPTSAPAPAAAFDTAAATGHITLGDAVVQATGVRLAALNPATAKRYGIDVGDDGVLLLVTLRDARGNALAPQDLALDASASVLPDPPKPLPLRAIKTGEMTDYIGVLHARPPASVQLKLQARRGGASGNAAITVELPTR